MQSGGGGGGGHTGHLKGHYRVHAEFKDSASKEKQYP